MRQPITDIEVAAERPFPLSANAAMHRGGQGKDAVCSVNS